MARRLLSRPPGRSTEAAGKWEHCE